MRKLSIGHKLYVSIMAVFLTYSVAFIIFQQNREKQYKIDTLELKLQMFNQQMAENLEDHPFNEAEISKYIAQHYKNNLRITLIQANGKVFYDNKKKDYNQMSNHNNREEIMLARKNGKGSVIDRKSKTLHTLYFYSATYFPKQQIFVRSSVPYTESLANSLRYDQHYIWVSLLGLALLTIIIYRFMSRLDNNIHKLKTFAWRADHNKSLEIEDLATFPDDELGEIAERIIKIYKRLETTRKQQDILKRQLTQNIAHELKTPVASIQGYLETILNNPNVKEEDKLMFLQRSYSQTERLTSLLRDISTLNRMDDGAQMLEKEEVDINALVRNIEAETAHEIEQHSMAFINHLPEGIKIKGVRSLLYSIFRNLTDNAIAYAGDNTTITLSAQKENNCYRFEFADNGIGVSIEHRPRLFERFYRIDKGRSRKMGGTGLGLAIVKNSVIHHNGTIEVTANAPQGLKFIFTLAE